MASPAETGAADRVDEEVAPDTRPQVFEVHLDNFSGPFDLLLQLISRHRLNITEVALSQVTDEFIAHVQAAGADWDLDRTSQFLLVAATLLDLKAARLLPSGEVEDSEDIAMLEVRDLLFARLLQYRAFKDVAVVLSGYLEAESGRHPRQVALEAPYAHLQAPLTFTTSPDRLAQIAARALSPRPAAVAPLDHLHRPRVSVREQADLLVRRLRREPVASFRRLVVDADRPTTVARFLALLELFRESAVAFEQVLPLGELTVRWTGSSGPVRISEEFEAASASIGGST